MAATRALVTVNRVPASPRLQAVDVRFSVIEDLTLKALYLKGELSTVDLSHHLCLPFAVADEVVQRLRKEQLCEATGMTGNIHHLVLTSYGRARAVEAMEQNRYSGPAPVSLDAYVQQVRLQTLSKMEVRAPDLSRIFSELVLDDRTLSQLGTAVNSGRSIFLYGPTGTGKTTIAQTLTQVFAEDRVWIPHSIEVDGQIIGVYDPLVHKAVQKAVPGDYDRRWVLCERPFVLVGGELTLEMLDLQFDSVTKFYVGSLQMKANNGLLIVDDFGRQRVHPDQLLNRWVVPLDRKVDYLSLAGGRKIEIPFDIVVVFATNLNPAELVEAAFLRRIQTKIRIDPVSPEQFHEIFRRVCKEFRLEYDKNIVNEVVEFILTKAKEPLRPCFPRDLANQISWASRYQDKPMRLDSESISAALASYFLAD